MNDFLKILNQFSALTKDYIVNFEKFNRYSIVHHSNSIEGSSLSEADTYLLLDEKLTPPVSVPVIDILMAVDHYNALVFLLDKAEKKIPLSEELLRLTASEMMKNTGKKISCIAGEFDSSKGEYRKLTVRAGNRTFISYDKVPLYVKKLIDYINKEINNVNNPIDIYKLSFEAHYQFVSVHPYADGNGRMSRLLMNYIQYYKKVPLSVIYKQDKSAYFNALEETRKNEDINIFYDFMFKQTLKHLKAQIKMLEKKQKVKKNKKGFNLIF